MLCLVAAILIQPVKAVIVQNGKSDWKIELDAKNGANLHGAKDIQTAIREMSGAELKMEAPVPGRKRVILIQSDPRLREEEYHIRTNAQGILISGGGKRGAMYGCYGFLQDVLGCRWFTASISSFPKKSTIAVPNLDIRERPAFEYRDPYFTEAFDGLWAIRNRVNGNFIHVGESMGGKVSYGRFVHTFAELVPPQVYFKDHPEYFSLVDGKRKDGYAQLCLTNPDVLRISIEKVRQWIQDNPTATIFSVSQNDTYQNCQCENCRAIEAQEESPAGPVLRFVNQVAAAIEMDHPNVLIDTLAYQWTEKPPKKEKPRKNVRIRMAPIGACFSHPLTACEKNKTPLANLEAWSKITNQVYIWHYCTDFAAYLQPLPCLDEIAGDIKLFRDKGVVGVFDEGAYGPGGGGDMAELKSYLLARLMWNPDLDWKKEVAEFLNGVYGRAAGQIQEWLDLTHQAARTANVHATIYDRANAPYFPDSLLERGQALFTVAEARTETQPKAREMVRKAKMGLLYLQVMRAKPGDVWRDSRAKELAESIRYFKVGQISEGRPVEEFLKGIGQG